MIMLYYVLAFIVMLLWSIILLYGLLRDISVRSKIVRLIFVYVLWKTVPPWGGPSVWGFVEHVGQSVPVWITALLILLLPIYCYGFKEILKESKKI